MSRIEFFALTAIAAFAIAFGAPKAAAQINFYIGVAPDCPYGYYDYVPHNCAPDGYYGPEWFGGGVFIGAGPWFHGSNDFQGRVDNTLDPQYGCNGPFPKVGDKLAAQRRSPEQFKENEVRDGRGNIGEEIPGSKEKGEPPAYLSALATPVLCDLTESVCCDRAKLTIRDS